MEREILFHGKLNANAFYKILMNSAQFYSEDLSHLCDEIWDYMNYMEVCSILICDKIKLYNIIKGSLFYDESLTITVVRCNFNDSIRILVQGHNYRFLLTDISTRFVLTTYLMNKYYEHIG